VLRPYASTSKPSPAVQQAQLTVLEDLRRRGLLSEAEFDQAKSRLAADSDND
jgi:hypothetical protein